MKHGFTVVTYREEDSYVAICLESDVSSFGDTREEAYAMITEALELHYSDQQAPEQFDSPEMKRVEVNTDFEG